MVILSVLVENINTVAKSGLDNCLNLDLDCSGVLFSDHPDLTPVIAVVWTPLYPSIFQRLPTSFVGLDKVTFCGRTSAGSLL